MGITNIIPSGGYAGVDPFAQVELNYRTNENSNISANSTRFIFKEDGGSPPNAIFELVNGVNKMVMTQKGVNPSTTNTIEYYAPVMSWQDDETSGSPAKLTMTLDQPNSEVIFTSPNKIRYDLTNLVYMGSNSYFQAANFAVGGGSSVTSTIWRSSNSTPLVIDSDTNLQVGTSGASSSVFLVSGASGQLHLHSETIQVGNAALSNPTILSQSSKSLVVTGSAGLSLNTTSGEGSYSPNGRLLLTSVTDDILIKTVGTQRKVELKVEPNTAVGSPADDVNYLKMEAYPTNYHADVEIGTDGTFIKGIFTPSRIGRVYADPSALCQYYVDGNSNDAIKLYRDFATTLVLMETPPNGSSIFGVQLNGIPTSWLGDNNTSKSAPSTVKSFHIKIINLSGSTIALVGQSGTTTLPDIPFWIGSAGSGNIQMTNGSCVEMLYIDTDDGVSTNNHSQKLHVISQNLN